MKGLSKTSQFPTCLLWYKVPWTPQVHNCTLGAWHMKTRHGLKGLMKTFPALGRMSRSEHWPSRYGRVHISWYMVLWTPEVQDSTRGAWHMKTRYELKGLMKTFPALGRMSRSEHWPSRYGRVHLGPLRLSFNKGPSCRHTNMRYRCYRLSECFQMVFRSFLTKFLFLKEFRFICNDETMCISGNTLQRKMWWIGS